VAEIQPTENRFRKPKEAAQIFNMKTCATFSFDHLAIAALNEV
jgi:hypothetical protein